VTLTFSKFGFDLVGTSDLGETRDGAIFIDVAQDVVDLQRVNELRHLLNEAAKIVGGVASFDALKGRRHQVQVGKYREPCPRADRVWISQQPAEQLRGIPR